MITYTNHPITPSCLINEVFEFFGEVNHFQIMFSKNKNLCTFFILGCSRKNPHLPDGWDSGNSRGRGVKDSGNPGGRGG